MGSRWGKWSTLDRAAFVWVLLAAMALIVGGVAGWPYQGLVAIFVTALVPVEWMRGRHMMGRM